LNRKQAQRPKGWLNFDLFNNAIADKGYDSEKLRQQIREREMIPRKESSKTENEDMDWCLYKYRHLVENFFGKLKCYRAIATRYDKLKRNYQSMIALACALSWLPM
jgi:transposase